MDEQRYLVNRLIPSVGDVGTIYSDDEMAAFKIQRLVAMVIDNSNVEYLVDRIIKRADLLRNGNKVGFRSTVKTQVVQYLTSWQKLGRFDQMMIPFEGKTYKVFVLSPISLLDYYNEEFIKSFADTILPVSDATKVVSVVDPSGMYAQQERVLRTTSKPIPFYERALYKRLVDTKLDHRIDETESPFYKMDHNPRMLDSERKKRNVSSDELPSYQDRQGLSYRMKPNY